MDHSDASWRSVAEHALRMKARAAVSCAKPVSETPDRTLISTDGAVRGGVCLDRSRGACLSSAKA
jgi:hypothetical protein